MIDSDQRERSEGLGDLGKGRESLTSGFSTPPSAVHVAAYSTSYTAVPLIPSVIQATIPSASESVRYTYQAMGSTEAASVASVPSLELSRMALGFKVYGYTVSASSMRSYYPHGQEQ